MLENTATDITDIRLVTLMLAAVLMSVIFRHVEALEVVLDLYGFDLSVFGFT